MSLSFEALIFINPTPDQLQSLMKDWVANCLHSNFFASHLASTAVFIPVVH